MRAALIQLCASDDPQANLAATRAFVAEAAAGGAHFVLTPEVTNCVSASRTRQNEVLQTQAEDITLAGLRAAASELGIWLLIGSLALKSDPPETRFANRSFLITPQGKIAAWYDKIHLFDVQVSATETYRESAGYAPGDRSVVVSTPLGNLGLSICYDLRFPSLFRGMAQAGAQILTIPSAFSPVTGAAHWEPLLRARAIENGAWVLAPAQGGTHAAQRGRKRVTYGHSLVVDPWGRVILDAGDQTGVHFFDLDLDAVRQAREKLPSLTHDRPFRAV